ncbi:acyltransferase family protein [Isobaculum melis]|uniref:Fucose 4-O-acetylase n=1 Tax=Isobaculum melis TaxID=142588 RepID=A0A1H9RUW1_9LACT|nr:acyltransferase family protein [Isobaculum melis]SER76650.1 Fucose 4-O-acetylase [Isobaculum melis]
MKSRENDIDYLKGIGIFFVVWGHVWLIPGDIFHYIYSFHMPLFFMLSGYLYYMHRERYHKNTFKQFIKNKARSLLVPYLSFYVVSLILTAITASIQLNVSFFVITLKGIFLSNHWQNVNNFALWYLPLSFIAIIIFYLLEKRGKWQLFLGVCLSLILTPISYQMLYQSTGRVPFTIHVLFPAIVFLAIGYWMNKYSCLEWLKKQYFAKTILLLIVGGIGLSTSLKWPSEILFIENIGYFVTAVLNLLFILWVSLNNQNKVISYLGKHSLFIYGLHRPIIHLMNHYQVERILNRLAIKGLFASLVITISAIIFSLLLMYIYMTLKKIILVNSVEKNNYQTP